MNSLNTIAQTIAGQIGSCLVGGTLILLFAGLLAHLLRQGTSRARFAVWFSGLVAVASVPLAAMAWSFETAHRLVPAGDRTAAITMPAVWALYAFAAWSLIASVALGRIAVGFWQVLVLRRHSIRLHQEKLAPELRETLSRFRPTRAVAILLSDKVQSPTAIGLLSPAIVFPAWLFDELSTAELRQILLHELEHLRRWDDWSNLWQKIVKALFFFHPAVWWMERQVSLEREMACDEAVLAQTGNPRAYAECLVLLAEKSVFRRGVMLAQAAVSRVGQTSRRITRILGAGNHTNSRIGKLTVPVFAAALIAGIALFARAPQLIAFQDNENQAELARAEARMSTLPMVVKASLASSPANAAAGKVLAKIPKPNAHLPSAIPAEQNHLADPVVEARLRLKANHAAAAMTPAAPSAEFLVVFMESRWNGSATMTVWQVEMWHVTMLRMKNPAPQTTPQKVI